MTDFSDKDLERLAYLVPVAQRLSTINKYTYKAWIAQLSDHERTILMLWIVKHRTNWTIAPVQAPDDADAA